VVVLGLAVIILVVMTLAAPPPWGKHLGEVNIPHGTSGVRSELHHAQAPTVLDHSRTLPQGDYVEFIGAKKHLVLGLLTNTGPGSNSFATGL